MDKYNAEGYPDPTAAEALANVALEEKKQFRRLVYVCSPFAGNIEHNINRARGYCRYAVNKEYIPLAPHLHYPQFMDDEDREQRELGLLFALILLCKCDEVWVFGGRVSGGMAREISKAKKRGIPIRYFTEKCEEVQEI
ncbi:DUF4406 domain-containing protein [Metallumcola ferriviriculae]|uniref:DUF4406 domain-containing protein n=1 Tax=Metallumcola ferriviriculae TaxID=3039180 RepID=A0AAU0UI30_9FIRM|nr:DUF4406 domain-containing protein [Desulfitibacteraceae bacterium MK1]